jgi:two-component system, NarL family, response regulator NreC
MTIRLLIADDHGVLRAGLRVLLNSEPDFEVVGEAADGKDAVEKAEKLQPDVMIMDISMPEMDGLEATRLIQKSCPNIQVLLLTVHEDDRLIRAALKAGAAGYITKRAAEAELVTAVEAVMRGEMYVHPSMMRLLLKELVPKEVESQAEDTNLTPREKEVLQLIAQGHTNVQIAQRLELSPRTVEGHRASLMEKLGLRNRLELVLYAEAHGLRE